MEVDHELRREIDLPDRSHLIEEVTPESVGSLKLTRASYFTPQRLILHVSESPGFVWKIRGQNEYVIAGRWRHRDEIGHILEMTYGRHRDILLSFVLDVFRDRGTKLVVIPLDDLSLYRAFYAKFGFERLDEIIELERSNNKEIPPTVSLFINKMSPEDLPAVLAVDKASFPWLWRNSLEEFEWYGSQWGVETYVARDDHGIIGYSGLTIRGLDGHLDRLAVLPSYQGQGYGSALLRYSIERMMQAGVRYIALSTQSSNKVSQQLYRLFGFRPTFRSQKIYGLWLDESFSIPEIEKDGSFSLPGKEKDESFSLPGKEKDGSFSSAEIGKDGSFSISEIEKDGGQAAVE